LADQRKTKRIFSRIPVRISGVDELGKPFSEETTTMEVSRDGARVALRRVPRFGAELVLTHLRSGFTVSSLVTHYCAQSYSGLPEWGVEFMSPVPDFWGINFEQSENHQELTVWALLLCQTCGRKEMANLSRAEYEELGEQFHFSRSCAACGRRTDWEVAAREEEEPPASKPDSLGDDSGADSFKERRRARRLALKVPILVTAPTGACEQLEAQDFSRHGLSFMSSLELEPGDRVQVTVGHGVAESPSIRDCLLIWRKPRERSGRHLYGVKFLDSKP